MNPERRRKGITKAKRVAKSWKQSGMFSDKYTEEEFMKTHIKNRKKCSCNMCCNARRNKRGRKNQKFPTIQEKEAERKLREGLDEYYDGMD